jgi:hypothetical protein
MKSFNYKNTEVTKIAQQELKSGSFNLNDYDEEAENEIFLLEQFHRGKSCQ